jgi:hypothetical protein
MDDPPSTWVVPVAVAVAVNVHDQVHVQVHVIVIVRLRGLSEAHPTLSQEFE